MSRASAISERSRTVRSRVRVLVAGGVAAGALALTGCGAGQITQTAEQVAAVSGANVTAGDIAIRNAEIVYPSGPVSAGVVFPKGSVAPVRLTLVNSGATPDRLISATTAAGGPVLITGDTTLHPQIALVATGEPGAPELAPDSKSFTVELTALSEDIKPGLTYPLVLVFEKAGRVTVDLPVGPPASARAVEPGTATH